MIRFAPLLVAATALVACAYVNPHLDAAKPHHTAEGFRNRYPHPEKGGFWDWKLEQWKLGLPKKPEGGYRFETVRTDRTALRENRLRLLSEIRAATLTVADFSKIAG